MIKSKKLSSLVAASLILAGGSFLGVQTVSADDSTRLAAVEALASQNHDSISELKETVKNISTTPEQLQQIDKNKADIAKEAAARDEADKAEAKARADKDTEHDTAIAANKKAIADEAAARVTADQTESTARDEADQAEAKARADKDTEHDTAIAANKKAIEDEAAARVTADQTESAARDAADKAEAKARTDKDTEHDTAIAANKKAIADEATARTDADTKLDTRITNVKENLQNETEKNYVSKGMYNRETSVADGAFVKEGQTVGQNLNAVDKGLNDEIAARIGADAAQDKRINETATNLAGLNQNVSDGFTALSNVDLQEAQTRAAKDTEHDTAIKANTDNIAQIKEDLAASNLEDMRKTAANLKNYDTQMSTVQALAAGNKDNIDKNTTDIAANTDAINKEVQDRTKAVTDEAKARADKDAAHDKAINDNTAAINKEVQDRTKAVADEAKARADKDAAHDKAINDNTAAINKEVQDRTKAVTDEADARTKAVADEAKARESGDNTLQNQIKKESAARQADISRLDNKIHDVSKEVDTVGALSMAMSGLHPLSYDEGDARFQLSAAVGTYDGTEALALGGFYHFNRDSMLSVGVATDLGADEHRMGANVGYTRRIGQGGHVSRPSEGTVSDIMKDIKNLEQKQAKLEQENEQLKQQLAALKK